MVATRFVSAGLRVCPVVLLVCAAASTSAHAQPAIDHPGIECIEPGKFAVILSGIDPDQEVQTAKVYFRSSLYPDFYYVEMTYEDGRFQGILPKPSPETTQIFYYLEAIDGVFNGTRSLEWDPLVQECDDDPAAAYFTGEETGIVVGATTGGQSAIPAGFSAAGIVGTIAATGVGAGLGGGVGVGTAAVVGAVAAGAAGAAVATGGTEEPTSTVIAGAPSSAVTTSTPVANPGPGTTSVPVPGSTTTVVSTTTVSGTTTSIAGSTTTSLPGTSTSTTAASTTSIVTTTVVPTTSVVTTTIAPTTSVVTTTVAPAVTACFTYGGKQNSCVHRWNASCSTGSIATYEWVVDTAGLMPAGTFNSPPSASPTIDVDWNPGQTPGGGCNNELITVQLIVTGTDSSVDTVTLGTWRIDLRAPLSSPGRRATLNSFLRVRPLDGTAVGRVVLNGSQADTTQNSGPFRHQFNGRPGQNVVEATASNVDGDGFWQFDFSEAEHFVSGSIRSEHGQVVIANDRTVVFRLSGVPDERIRFTYQRGP